MPVFISEQIPHIFHQIVSIQWDPSQSFLAVVTRSSSDNGDITIFNSSKMQKLEGSQLSRPYPVTCSSWNPVGGIFIVGWSTGSATIIDVKNGTRIELKSISEKRVSSISWSEDGFILLITHVDGHISIFLPEEQGQIPQQPQCTISTDANILCSVWIPPSKTQVRRKDVHKFKEQNICVSPEGDPDQEQSDFTGFIFGCSDGRVMSMNCQTIAESREVTSSKNIDKLATCEGQVVNMLYHPSKKYLVVATNRGLIYHFRIRNNEVSLNEMAKVKVAATFETIPSLVWCNDCVLAIASGESSVRLWDMEHGDNSTLTPDLFPGDDEGSVPRITQVAYSSKLGTLAAGLSNGQVAFWTRGPAFDASMDLGTLLEADPTLLDLDSNMIDPCCLHSVQPAANPIDRVRANAPALELSQNACWHSQPNAFLTTKPENKFPNEFGEPKSQIRLLAWDTTGECLAVASTFGNQDDSLIHDNSFDRKSEAYILKCQPNRSCLTSTGSVVVQSSPNSLALFIATEQKLDQSSPLMLGKRPRDLCSTKSSTDPSMAFVTTSSMFVSGATHRAGDSFKTNLQTVIREYEAQVVDQIRALYTTSEYVAYWSGSRISVFRHTPGDCLIHQVSFPCEFELVGMYHELLITVEPCKLHVRNLQGTVTQLINFTESEGSVIQTGQCAGVMVCLTDTNFVRILDLTKREVRVMGSAQSITTTVLSTASSFGTRLHGKVDPILSCELRISSISVNSTGNAISFAVQVRSDGSVAETWWPTRSSPDDQHSDMQPANDGVKERKTNHWLDDTRLYIYYLERDQLHHYDLASQAPCKSEHGSYLEENALVGRWPKHHYWDQYDPKLLVIQAEPLPDSHPVHQPRKSPPTLQRNGSVTPNGYRPDSHEKDKISKTSRKSPSESRSLVLSLFASPDQSNPIVQEEFSMAPHHSDLLGIECPYYYFAVRCDLINQLLRDQVQKRRETISVNRCIVSNGPDSRSELQACSDQAEDEAARNDHGGTRRMQGSREMNQFPDTTKCKVHYINRRIMRDFLGLGSVDANTREAVLNFSYYMTMGEIDAAFKAMKLIKSSVVWENMARMCVSTCRLDVARVCLGKMGNPMAAMMVREARLREPEPEAQAGELAIQLGMHDEAERLFVKCGRWDLVIRLHQAMGRMEKATQVATQHNRILLRNTHYVYAKELEARGKVDEAVEHYIKSETHRFEIPRMLQSECELLEQFVIQQEDKSVKRWWAKHLESEGRLDEAKVYYLQANDYLSAVRVLCCLGQSQAAEALCNETGDPAACYHLARQVEPSGNVDQAIRLFTRAKACTSAVRLCKEHNRNDHLYSLAQLGRPEDMLDAAAHLEHAVGYEHKAVLLYHKAGHIGRAVELAFRTQQYAALQAVAGSLDEKIDPTLLKRCAEFFTQNNQYDRAVDVLAAGKQYWDALRICAEYNVSITDDLVEKLTPVPNLVSLPESERLSILMELGEMCLAQGHYHQACKKFTQAGNRMAAMKALLRSGDTEKIIFFANVSKQSEIYVMAANYLQTLEEWRSDVDLMRTIVQFYTRGRAPESLALFYESCAQAEIEEFQSYEKAAGALTEAYKTLIKALSSRLVDDVTELRLQRRLSDIEHKATLCKEFAETQMLFTVDPIEAMRNCQRLLETIDHGEIVRIGDVYAAMIHEFVDKQKYQAALACIQEMRERLMGTGHGFAHYIDRKTLEAIHEALNLPMIDHSREHDSKFTDQKNQLEVIESPDFDEGLSQAGLSDESDRTT